MVRMVKIMPKPKSASANPYYDELAEQLRNVRLDALPRLLASLREASTAVPPALQKGSRVAAVAVEVIAAEVLALPEKGSKLDLVQRAVVIRALKESGGNISAAARSLGVDRKVLERKIARYKLKRR
jgi:transcriptional regulator of acetoin/glycerol metabolism